MKDLRFGLFNQSNFKNLVFYALSEILLVVVGILIAVSINNWNNNRKFENTERITLERMLEDLNSDLQRFDFLTSSFGEKISNCDTVIELIQTQRSITDRINLVKIDFDEVFLIEPNTITYEEMINTGRLYSLTDSELRSKILYYYRQLDKWGKYVEKYNQQLRQLAIQPELRDYWTIRMTSDKSSEELAEKYYWLNANNSEELKTIESYAYISQNVAQNNIGTIRFLNRKCGELIASIQNTLEK